MSDAVEIQIILSVATLLALIISGFVQVIMARTMARTNEDQKTRASLADVKVEGVRRDLRVSNEMTKEKLDEAAMNVLAVKKTLQVNAEDGSKKLDELAVVAHATHTLVNNNMSLALEANAKMARKIAGLTGRPEDVSAASEAETKYADHMDKQAVVDAQPGSAALKTGAEGADEAHKP